MAHQAFLDSVDIQDNLDLAALVVYPAIQDLRERQDSADFLDTQALRARADLQEYLGSVDTLARADIQV